MSKTLILTNSYDATTDLLIDRLGSERVFRLNIDRWLDCEVLITASQLRLRDEFQGVVKEDEIAKVYWRKPFFDVEVIEETYARQEILYMVREIHNLFRAAGKAVLTEPGAERRLGKILQSRLASRFFSVPQWAATWNAQAGETVAPPHAAKSLSSEPVLPGRVLYTTLVNCMELETRSPWYIQQAITAPLDVTVVAVGDKLFAYECDRSQISGLDWRRHITEGILHWRVHSLNEVIKCNIREFLAACGLRFGRIDFLCSLNGEYHFLEINPNGQWAWLDLDGTGGLLSTVVRELDPTSISDSLLSSSIP